MYGLRKLFSGGAILMAGFVSGCGLYVPNIEEAWEPVDVPLNLEYRIKQHIFCETVKALRAARDPHTGILFDGKPAVPDSYGIQMQVNLTVEENTSLNPGLSLNKTLPNAIASGVTVPQSFTLGFGGTASSTATRTDTSYSYYNVGKISGPGKNTWCDKEEGEGSSLLLQSNLGIFNFLQGAAPQNDEFQSSKVPSAAKDAKSNIYSYDVKFVVVSNGNVNPTWKLVNVSADTGSNPLFGIGRTRTHELILTFGPGATDEKDKPSLEALETHFTTQLSDKLNSIGHNH